MTQKHEWKTEKMDEWTAEHGGIAALEAEGYEIVAVTVSHEKIETPPVCYVTVVAKRPVEEKLD